jgi:glycine/D-amino acid oxidase-like deaminating enzyme
LIIGGGFAGASTAFHLSEVHRGSILVIDREKVPGVHASGRNAGLIRQSVTDPMIRRAVAASQPHYAQHGSEVGFRPCGSLLLGKQSQLEEVRETQQIASVFRPPEEVRRRVPLLDGHPFEAALETPADGVTDIWALLQHYLQGARARGVQVRLDCEVRSISGPSPYRVETSRGPIEASALINAAGAWAPQIAEMAGATPLPLVPWKRHLFALEQVSGLQSEWPFVWNLDRPFYFRPESRGLLLSICDEERSAVLEPTVSPGISEAAAELVWKELPALRGAREREVWSCFRTKATDGRFVIGWDPSLERFFWVAGLGGDGVGSSWEVGRLAASAFADGETEPGGAFAPSRFAAP